MISEMPIIGALYQWWINRTEKLEINNASTAFENLLKNPVASEIKPLKQKTVALLEHCKDNPGLKKEAAKLERSYFAFLIKKGILPSAYVIQENRDLVDKFAKLGISPDFLRRHPEFLSIAKEHFWQHYFPFVKLPVQMLEDELYIPFETAENTNNYTWKSWSRIKELNLENFRITYHGFAVGHPDHSKHLVPLKTVAAGNKYALQFVTSCPVGRALPSNIDFKTSGHSFTQIILPKEGSAESEVYSVGYYPRKISDLGFQFFKTVPGVYRNHDSNVSRIQAGQMIPIVKQYIFQDDLPSRPCLFSLVQNMDAIRAALETKGLTFDPITIEQIDKAMLERNEPELDRILIGLNEIRELIVKGKLSVPVKTMESKDKALTMMKRFEESQGKHSYNILGSNCTSVSYRQESFAVAFLDAKLDSDKAVQVYDSQVDIRDHKFSIIDRIRDLVEWIFLHFFAALPLTGPLLGTGSTHPDAVHLKSTQFIPPILSETAFATHQMLTAPFTPRPLFPAGEILAQNTPIIKPPGFFARLKYLLNRDSLLK